jgi:hypothetical protein
VTAAGTTDRSAKICAEYDDEDLRLLAGFLDRAADAARTAAARLAAN